MGHAAVVKVCFGEDGSVTQTLDYFTGNYVGGVEIDSPELIAVATQLVTDNAPKGHLMDPATPKPEVEPAPAEAEAPAAEGAEGEKPPEPVVN